MGDENVVDARQRWKELADRIAWGAVAKRLQGDDWPLRSLVDALFEAALGADDCEKSPRIAGVAYDYNGTIYFLPRPARHCHVLWAYGDMSGRNSGFVTDTGEFVDREEAWRIAEEAGQLKGQSRTPGTLYSEDVW